MVDTVDGEEEHPGVIPSSSMDDGGTSVSREEFNVALDTLKTSVMVSRLDLVVLDSAAAGIDFRRLP